MTNKLEALCALADALKKASAAGMGDERGIHLNWQELQEVVREIRDLPQMAATTSMTPINMGNKLLTQGEMSAIKVDGWIEWAGGDRCPVASGDFQVRFRDGRIITCGAPSGLRWGHIGENGDIVAYRLVDAHT